MRVHLRGRAQMDRRTLRLLLYLHGVLAASSRDSFIDGPGRARGTSKTGDFALQVGGGRGRVDRSSCSVLLKKSC